MTRFLLIALTSILLSACSGKEGKINKAAHDYGVADAQTFIQQAGEMTDLEKEGFILGIRSNEYAYRAEGHDKAADLYIEGFESYLKENSDSLSKLIF